MQTLPRLDVAGEVVCFALRYVTTANDAKERVLDLDRAWRHRLTTVRAEFQFVRPVRESPPLLLREAGAITTGAHHHKPRLEFYAAPVHAALHRLERAECHAAKAIDDGAAWSNPPFSDDVIVNRP